MPMEVSYLDNTVETRQRSGTTTTRILNNLGEEVRECKNLRDIQESLSGSLFCATGKEKVWFNQERKIQNSAKE